MPTPTEDDITAIIKTRPSIELDPFIAYGEELYNDHCSEAGYTSAKELKIKTLLACHFYTVRDPRRSGEQVDTIRNDYQSKINYGLSLSHYGQMAMLMDSEGGLANFNNQIFNQVQSAGVVAGGPSVKWLGAPNSRGRRRL
jgi:hypothetical protein